ncbi:MAG: glycosyltransferase family 39 protein [Planctomycetes bacterium]|nr:glycosyltransferase family 39 protein [Planctomycetota bacterium]
MSATPSGFETDPLPAPDRFALRVFPLLALLFHLATAQRYGVFRDEFYYVACGQHLAFGYVDHPPFVALVARVATALFGTSLLGLRLFPALAGAATAWAAASLARELGGRAYAQRLAALCVTLGGNTLFSFQVLSMNSFDHLAWALLAWLAARALRTGVERYWLLFGLVAGLGLENKISVLFLGAGIALGVLLFRRDVLARRGIWLGAALAGLLFLPHVLWQLANGFPTREFIANAQADKMVAIPPLQFVLRAGLEGGAGSIPVALVGLVGLWLAKRWRALRPLAVAFVAVLALLAFTRSKPYYAAPAFVLVFAAGGATLEALHGKLGTALRALVLLVTLGLGAMAAPFAKPLLSEDAFVRYSAALGAKPSSAERNELGRLPQHFADMHGWRALAEEVARVCATLPPEERASARVFGQNYGEAGAIDFFADELGLPPALSGHNNYFLWGPGDWSGEVLIVIDDDRAQLLELFEEVELAGKTDCTDCMPYEDELPIWICRRLKRPVAELWPQVKHFI